MEEPRRWLRDSLSQAKAVSRRPGGDLPRRNVLALARALRSLRPIVDTTTTEARSRTRLFRRYTNRKLYDTHESRYVNLAHVAKVIRTGSDVRVLDSETLEDLTGIILARILSFERKTVSGPCRRRVYDLVRESGRDATEGAGTAPAPSPEDTSAAEAGPERRARPPDAADPDWPERLVDGLLSRGHRNAWRAREMVAACLAALGRLDDRARRRAGAASLVSADIDRLRHQLSTLSSKLDVLNDRLLELERREDAPAAAQPGRPH